MLRRCLSSAVVLTAALLPFSAVVACGKAGGGTTVSDTFNHSCRADDDCAIAFFGPTCGICSSSNAAIAKSDQAAYQKAYNDARDHCPKENVVGDCAASFGVSQCTAGKCAYVSCESVPKDEHHCR